MEILLSITLILIGSVSAHSPKKLEWIHPIHFTEVTSEAYVYTSIETRTYVERFLLTEDTIVKLVDEVLITPIECTEIDNRCHELQENIKEFTKQELRSILFEMRHDIDDHIRRHKRFLPITAYAALGIGATIAIHEWLDVDLKNNVNILMEANTVKELQINGILKTLETQFHKVANLSLDLNGQLENIKKELAKFVGETTFRTLIWNQITQLMFHYDNIRDSCNRRVIPSSSVDLRTLSEFLQNLEKVLGLKGMTLAIPQENIEDYYKVRICSCEFSDNAINITVHIPIKPDWHRYKLYSPIYLPFKFGDEICSIQAYDALLIVNTNSWGPQVWVSSAQYLKDCDLATHLCKVPAAQNSNMHSLCLQETFLGKNVTELRKLCPFICTPIPVNKPLINHLRQNEFVITNIPDNTSILYKDGSRSRLLNTNQDGAFKLDLPCTASLLYFSSENFYTLINESPLCSEEGERNVINLHSHTLERVIPLQWAANVTGSTAILHTKWKNSTLTYSFEGEPNAARLTANADGSWRPTHAGDPYATPKRILNSSADNLINNNVYLGICFCNLIAVFFLYLQNRSMKNELQQIKKGSISRGEDITSLLQIRLKENFIDR